MFRNAGAPAWTDARQMAIAGIFLLLAALGSAQQPTPKAPDKQSQTVTVPAGTRVLLVLLSPISSKSAQPGSGVYLRTAAPISAGNQTVIPAGSYIQGTIDRVVRPGKVKGRAQLQMHFTSVTFPSGYHTNLPATLGGLPAEENARMGKEGTVQANSQHGKDAITAGSEAGTGALIGGLSDGARGAGIGAGIGGALGIVTVLLTRGDDIRLNAGDPVEMVLERPLVLDHVENRPSGYTPVPRPAPSRTRENRFPAGRTGPIYLPPVFWP